MGFLKLIRLGVVILAGVLVVNLIRRAGARSQAQRRARHQGRKYVQSKEIDHKSK